MSLDPFEARLQFLGLLRKLSASQQSIQTVVSYALKYGRKCGEDLWDCIVEECGKVSLTDNHTQLVADRYHRSLPGLVEHEDQHPLLPRYPLRSPDYIHVDPLCFVLLDDGFPLYGPLEPGRGEARRSGRTG